MLNRLNKLNKLNNFNNQKYKQNLQLQRTKTTTTHWTLTNHKSVFWSRGRQILSRNRTFSIRLQNLAPEKFGTRLYDRRARNRRQFSGVGFWRRFLERVSWALVATGYGKITVFNHIVEVSSNTSSDRSLHCFRRGVHGRTQGVENCQNLT